jgi:hypothetical protein
MKDTIERPTSLQRVFQNSLMVVLVASLLFFIFYLWRPLPGDWNDLVGNALNVIVSILTAIWATLIVREFKAGEPPQLVWLFFCIALWLSVLAGLFWFVPIFILQREAPTNLTNALWLIGACAFSVSSLFQYRLVYLEQSRRLFTIGGLVGAGILAVSLIANVLYRQSVSNLQQPWLDTFMTFFFPLATVLLTGASLHLSRLFVGGMWGRIWMCLLAFTAYTVLDMALTMSGLIGDTGWVRAIADTLFFGAYLALAFGTFMQYMLLHHGLSGRVQEMLAGEDQLEIFAGEQQSVLEIPGEQPGSSVASAEDELEITSKPEA